MDFPIPIDTISIGLTIVFFQGSQVDFSKLSGISVPVGCFNPSKQCRLMKCSIVLNFIHLGLQCLPEYPFRGFQHTKGSETADQNSK